MSEPSKYCRKCNLLFPFSQFYKSKNYKSYPDGRIAWCKGCMSYYKKSKKERDTKDDRKLYQEDQGFFTVEFD